MYLIILAIIAALICIGIFIIITLWIRSAQKDRERYVSAQQAIQAYQTEPAPDRIMPRSRLYLAVPHKVTSPIHEYLYLDGDFPTKHENSPHSVVHQFAIQSDGSLRRMSPSIVPVGGDSEIMAVSSQLRLVYVDDDTTGYNEMLRPYRIKSNGTLQPLPTIKLNISVRLEELRLDPQNHCLYLAIDDPQKLWYRYRIHDDGKLAMPAVKVAPRHFPAANGFVYDMNTSFLDISRVSPSGMLRHVARQQTPAYSDSVMPDSFEVAPSGRYAYLYSWERYEPLMACRIDKYGGLTVLNRQATPAIVKPVVSTDPSGRFLYVLSIDDGGRMSGDGNINAYRMERNGTLSLVQSFWIGPTGDVTNMAAVKISR